jgi:glycerophosphoryl diester phosphodiesterase
VPRPLRALPTERAARARRCCILAIPQLAAKGTQPFSPADPSTGKVASANCCTSDITLAEFKTLCGKMDASNPNASTVAEYLGGTANYRTDLYATCGTVLSHKESIALIDGLGLKFTPELRRPAFRCPSTATTARRSTRSR